LNVELSKEWDVIAGTPFMASTSQAVYQTQLVDIRNKDLP